MWTKDFICSQLTFQNKDHKVTLQYSKNSRNIIPIIPFLGIYQKTSFIKHKQTKLGRQGHRPFLCTDLRLRVACDNTWQCVSFTHCFSVLIYHCHLPCNNGTGELFTRPNSRSGACYVKTSLEHLAVPDSRQRPIRLQEL